MQSTLPRSHRLAKYGFLTGAALVGGAVVWQLLAGVVGIALPGWELLLVRDAELIGAGVGSLALFGALTTRGSDDDVPSTRVEPDTTVYVTSGLLDVLLQFAEDAEPRNRTIGLATTPAGALSDAAPETSAWTPVFSHFYMPDAAKSTSDVFGVDLGTPPGRTRGVFHSHSQGPLAVTKRDDLHGIILVATAPWDRDSVAAFDRRGRRHPLRVVDATPPDEPLPEAGEPGGPTGL